MAVFTKLEKEDFEKILEGYDLGKLIYFEGISEGIENTNYIISTEKASYIFTIYERRVSDDDLPFFMELMEKLSADKFPCPKPIHQKNQNIVGKISGKSFTIVSMLKGKWSKAISVSESYKAGKILGMLHKKTSEFSDKSFFRQNSMGKDFWKETYSKVSYRAEKHFPDLKKYTDRAFKVVTENYPENLPSGIIHGDYFPDNVLFDRGRISGVIDFYMSCNDFYVYDLAIAINSWCFEKDNSFNEEKASEMLRGYHEERKLGKVELENLPTIFIGACLRFLSTRLFDYFNRVEEAVVSVKDPSEYIEKLKFHLQIRSYKEYGF